MEISPVRHRSDALRSHLEELCRRLGPGAKLPRMAELQLELGTSPTTLNKILGEMEAAGLVMRRRSVGVFVAESAPCQLEHLALVCRPSFFQTARHSPVWSLLLELLNARAQAGGTSFDSYFSREGDQANPLPRPLMREVEGGRIGGVMGVGLSQAAASWLMERVPVVNLYGKGHVIVGIDVAQAFELCLEQLKERGCERIGLWTPALTMGDPEGARTWLRQTTQSFQKTLALHDLPFEAALVQSNENWLLQPPPQQPLPAEQGYQTARAVLQGGGPRPDGVLIGDDLMARGALAALRELGARDTMPIATLSNVGTAVLLAEPNLILAEFDPAQIVAAMWQQMESLRAQTPAERLTDQHLDIPARLRLT